MEYMYFKEVKNYSQYNLPAIAFAEFGIFDLPVQQLLIRLCSYH